MCAPLPVIAALTGLGGGVSANAKDDIYVKNCTQQEVFVAVTDDINKARPLHPKWLALAGIAKGKSDNVATKIACETHGKCKVYFSIKGASAKEAGETGKEEYFILTDAWTKHGSLLKVTTKTTHIKSSVNKACSEL
jgi:hypothetical protein